MLEEGMIHHRQAKGHTLCIAGDKNRIAIVTGFERALVIAAMQNAGGSQGEAARQLKIPRQTLNSRLKRLGLKS